MVSCGLAPSNKQARQLVEQGGVFVNDEKVPAATFQVTEAMLKEKKAVLLYLNLKYSSSHAECNHQ